MNFAFFAASLSLTFGSAALAAEPARVIEVGPSEQLALHREEQPARAHAEIRVGALAFATSHASSLSISAVAAHSSHQAI